MHGTVLDAWRDRRWSSLSVCDAGASRIGSASGAPSVAEGRDRRGRARRTILSGDGQVVRGVGRGSATSISCTPGGVVPTNKLGTVGTPEVGADEPVAGPGQPPTW